jgi:Domain of unknown function (DUF4167)
MPPQSRIGKTLVMRNNQQNKRMRGRNRKSHNPLTRVYESNGPDVKIRGTASHVAEKYQQLARDAQSSGDPVSAENYLQHAEHYFRLIAAAQEQFRQTTPFFRDGIDARDDMRDDMGEDGDDEAAAPAGGGEQPLFGPRDPQPYLPRDAQFFQQREQPSFGGRHSSKNNNNNNSNNNNNDDDSNVERLPSFITGGATPQNGQNGSQPGFSQNGFEAQGDRFPLHRRRRRHRTTRGELGQGQADGDDSPHAPRQNGE